jgi:hypothetical protein
MKLLIQPYIIDVCLCCFVNVHLRLLRWCVDINLLCVYTDYEHFLWLLVVLLRHCCRCNWYRRDNRLQVQTGTYTTLHLITALMSTCRFLPNGD